MTAGVEQPITGDVLARRLVEVRREMVRRHAARNARLGFDEVDDVYGEVMVSLLEREPPADFKTEWALRAWLNEALRRALLHHSRSSAVRLSVESAVLDGSGSSGGGAGSADDGSTGPVAVDAVSSDFTPEQHVLITEEHDALTEYLAGLRPGDRRIALLWLWPSSQLTPKAIAALLDVPLPDVRAAIHRVNTDFRRYSALTAAGVCRKQMRYLERWRRDGGEMPLQLDLHSRRCPRCRASVNRAREHAYEALLPLAPGVALPAVGLGSLAVKASSVAGALVRGSVGVGKRLLPTTKQGAGSALVATKSGTVAVVTAATVAVGAAGTVAVIHAEHHAVRPAVAAGASTATTPVDTTPGNEPTVPAASASAGTGSDTTTSTISTATATTTSTPMAGSDPAPSVASGGASDPSPGDSGATAAGGTSSFTPSGSAGSSGAGLSPTGKTPAAP